MLQNEIQTDAETADETDEIKITNAMIEAGVAEVRAFDRRYQESEDLAILVYEAMVKARSARPDPDRR